MTPFAWRDGRLHAENVDLRMLADDVGTPTYVYSTAALERNFRAFSAACPPGSLIAFSVKANGNLAVLATLAGLGAGADVVSGGELKLALAAGIHAKKIVFSGVGKTRSEMREALAVGIYQFNVESEPELRMLGDVARELGVCAPVALRINPDVDAGTHAKITTGTAETKFGIPYADATSLYGLADSLPGIRVVGIDLHIGSQIAALAPFEAAFARIAGLTEELRRTGLAIDRIDFGGGVGVAYDSDSTALSVEDYGALAGRFAGALDVHCIFEPGRAIAADAGVLLARVTYVKSAGKRQFLILDAGMNDLLRPALYDARHGIVPVVPSAAAAVRYDVVGPVCETADLFARDCDLPPLAAGDLVAILSAGAYGAVMSSAYNARPPAAEVLVRGSEWDVVRPRMSIDALVERDRLPAWL